MLHLNQSGTFQQRISKLSVRLKNSSNHWDKMSVELAAGSRQVHFAQGDFRRAEDAATWASRDNGRTDSSRHGDRVEGGFADGTRNLDWAESLVRRSDRRLNTFTAELENADSDFQQLIRDMQSVGDARLSHVQEAAAALDRSENSFTTLAQDFDQFQSGGKRVDRHARGARHDIEEIVRDRPGFNVSRAARRVQAEIQKITQELTELSDKLQSSRKLGAKGDQDLAASLSYLEQAK